MADLVLCVAGLQAFGVALLRDVDGGVDKDFDELLRSRAAWRALNIHAHFHICASDGAFEALEGDACADPATPPALCFTRPAGLTRRRLPRCRPRCAPGPCVRVNAQADHANARRGAGRAPQYTLRRGARGAGRLGGPVFAATLRLLLLLVAGDGGWRWPRMRQPGSCLR